VIVLGLSGGSGLPQEVSAYLPTWQHDAAAVLIEDGKVVAAVEEERLNRIKHTNCAPLKAAQYCLQARGITAADLDRVAFYWDDGALNKYARMAFLKNARQPAVRDARATLREIFGAHFGVDLPSDRFHFVRHHIAHAFSAFTLSGYERSLVVTLDAQGDSDAGLVALGDCSLRMTELASVGINQSLGYLYQDLIMFLGYKMFDEYKVMGLAPYGDPERYRASIQELYCVLPEGGWQLHRRMDSLYEVITPRRKGEEFTQAHKDFAAAIQYVLEDIVFHLLTHHQKTTKERNLCLAGGVAHNCTLNGKILASGLFERVFVQPASHDAGAALGAALKVYLDTEPTTRGSGRRVKPAPAAAIRPLEHVYWGPDIGPNPQILHTLERWSDFITFEMVSDISARAAKLVADGRVIGWVQGRSEFGPRALGNRSIVADPRPADNKTLINAMVKKREGYRPFAPSVLVEDAHEYFDLPCGTTELPYMTFVVSVRAEKRELLGAVTHVDGTARVQTVSAQTNERYWRLIKTFAEITGVPVVLNTSFNNNAEPIVDSAEDAVACFLTTGLHALAIGDWLVQKRRVPLSAYARLTVSIPSHYRLTHTRAVGVEWQTSESYHLINARDADDRIEVSKPVHDVLSAADGLKTIGALCAMRRLANKRARAVLKELHDLWSSRAVILTPQPRGRRVSRQPSFDSTKPWMLTRHRDSVSTTWR
jgi:carbamoyltransferase